MNKSLTFKKFIIITLSIIICLSIVIFFWFFRYRFKLLVSTEIKGGMVPGLIEGYSDKLFYFKDDSIKFYLKSNTENNNIYIDKIISPYNHQRIYKNSFGLLNQETNNQQSELGCNWKESLKIKINDLFDDGYYIVTLVDNFKNEFSFPFIINDKQKNKKITLLAPTSTWVAYNAWGGKSLYDNIIDSSNVYFVSTNRPNTLLEKGKHDINVEANIFNWFEKEYDINIYPDNILDQYPDILDDSDIIILSYHCEYISAKTYNKLIELIEEDEKSLISIGGNQIYWKSKWNATFDVMECRKDLTFFENSYSLGGMWKHNFRSEDQLLGVRYSKSGYGTYYPYKLIQPNHWLLKDISTPTDSIFGELGINELPLSGLETDKVTRFSKNKVDLIAKGLNPNDGGGHIVIKKYNNNAVLSTGSIQSGAGLGMDSVFTKIISNFVERYSKK